MWVNRVDAMKLLGVESESAFTKLVKKYKVPHRRGAGNASVFERAKLLVVVRKRAEKAAQVEQEKLQAEKVAAIEAKAKVLGVELQKATAPTVSNIVGAGKITARAFKLFADQATNGAHDLAAVAIELEITGEEVEDLFLTWWRLGQRSQEWKHGPANPTAPQAVVLPLPAAEPAVASAPAVASSAPANDSRGHTKAQREYLARWAKQQEEWDAIAAEFAEKHPEGFTPHQVTTEQRKRALARGEKLLTDEDLKAVGG